MTYDQMVKKYGTVEHEGETLALTGQAEYEYRSDNPCPNDWMSATAVRREDLDEDGDYEEPFARVWWCVTNPGAEDGADLCDWSDYTVDQLIAA